MSKNLKEGIGSPFDPYGAAAILTVGIWRHYYYSARSAYIIVAARLPKCVRDVSPHEKGNTRFTKLLVHKNPEVQ